MGGSRHQNGGDTGAIGSLKCGGVKINKRLIKTSICISLVALFVVSIAGCSTSTTSSSSNTAGRVTAQYEGNGNVKLTVTAIPVGRVPVGKFVGELTFFKLYDSNNNVYTPSGEVTRTLPAGYTETITSGVYTERHGTISVKGTEGTDLRIAASGSVEDITGTIYFGVPQGVRPQKLIYDDDVDSFTVNL